jgi:glycosyltransferase involved in cell wall biosynthesis
VNILGHLERFAPPVGGGVVTTVTILRELARRGHDVRILTHEPGALNVQGVQFIEASGATTLRGMYQWADVAVPHMDTTPVALTYAREMGTSILYPVHDDGQFEKYGLVPGDVALAVFNAYGLKERTSWPGEQTVVHPPVFIDEHRVNATGNAITIASLSAEKGGETFWKIVDRLPDRQFIGVTGGWGDQVIPESLPPNVEIIGHQGNNLREIFKKTRILLVPSQRLCEGSKYWTENWGRAAIEAAASGIPTIANPAPGPLEALGDAGIFHDRMDIDSWIGSIKRLDDPANYQHQSDLVYHRAEELEQIVREQLDDLSARLPAIAKSRRREPMIPLD